MICEKCNTENEKNSVYCSNCNTFLNTEKIKELFSLAKEYIQKKNYYDASVIILNCLKLAKDSQYEKQLSANLKVVKTKLKKDSYILKDKIQEAISYEKQKNKEKALSIWKILLELQVLNEETNNKINKRIEILENTTYLKETTNNKTISEPDEKKKIVSSIETKNKRKFNIQHTAIAGLLLIISAFIINNLFIRRNRGQITTNTNETEQTITTNTAEQPKPHQKPIDMKINDLIFFTDIYGYGHTYETSNEKNNINEYTLIYTFPVEIKTLNGHLTLNFNNKNIQITLMDNTSLSIIDDKKITLKLNKGICFIDNNYSPLHVSTPLSEAILPENSYIINNSRLKDKIIVGPYAIEDGYIYNKNFPRYIRDFQKKSMIIIKPDEVPSSIVHVDYNQKYNEIIVKNH